MSVGGTAIVTGVGPGLGASICRRLVSAGYCVAGLARSSEHGPKLAAELASTGRFRSYSCDVSRGESVKAVVDEARSEFGAISVLIHNASSMHIDAFMDTSAGHFEDLWRVTCLGAVNSAHAVLPDMLAQNSGTMIFTGATAAIRGGARFSAFASAKFALRGLAQSLAREYGPRQIHVTHVLLDGLIWAQKARDRVSVNEEDCLHPDAIAEQYVGLINQDRSTWTQELDLRPYSESY